MKHRLIKGTLLFGMMLFCATGTGFAGESGNVGSCPLGISGEAVSITQKYFCRRVFDPEEKSRVFFCNICNMFEPEYFEPTNDEAGSITGNVANLVNEERKKAGLSALESDAFLSAAAQKKAEDMKEYHYFSHTSPTYGNPFEMMRAMGISFSAAGENIAKNQKTPEQVMEAWMNSQGHRANILSTVYKKIGIGYAVDENGTTYWVQLFVK